MSFFSGVVDDCDRVHLGGYLGPLAETLGVSVEEFVPLSVEDAATATAASTTAPFHDEASVSVVRLAFEEGNDRGEGAGSEATGTIWSEVVHLRGAHPIACFAAGTAWYLATRPDESATRNLLHRMLHEAGVQPPLPDLPEGVQISIREGRGERYVILLNHGSRSRSVPLPDGLTIEVGDGAGTVELPAFGVAVLRGNL